MPLLKRLICSTKSFTFRQMRNVWMLGNTLDKNYKSASSLSSSLPLSSRIQLGEYLKGLLPKQLRHL